MLPAITIDHPITLDLIKFCLYWLDISSDATCTETTTHSRNYISNSCFLKSFVAGASFPERTFARILGVCLY